jgi:tetratricopeptide (TPR) repeat protein
MCRLVGNRYLRALHRSAGRVHNRPGENTFARLLRGSLARNSSDAGLWNLLGIAEGEQGHNTDAIEAFRKGITLAPRSPSLYENLGLLYYRNAVYLDAERVLAKAVDLGSKKPVVRFSLAASRIQNGKAGEALPDLRALEPALGQRGEYWTERGMAELASNPAAARESFDRALAIMPHNLRALNGAAWAAEKREKDEEALSFLIRARAAAPHDVGTLLHFTLVCLRRNLGPDAVAAAQEACRLEPKNDSALYLLARAKIAVEEWQGAYDLFDQFSRRVPAYPLTWFALGWLDEKLNRPAQARANLEHALTLAPQLADARYELSQVYLNDGNEAKATSELNIILRQNPHHAKANSALGEILMRHGDFAAAERHLQAAILEDPNLTAAHYRLSKLYYREHRTAAGDRERDIAASLAAHEREGSKLQLMLAEPESHSPR